MTTYKILLTYMNVSDADLPQTAEKIINRMTGNARYPDPTPTIDVVEAGLVAYQKNLSLVRLGDETAMSLKNQTRSELKLLLHKLGGYVIGAARNDLEALLSSGFDISKTRGKNTLEGLSIAAGAQSGQVISTMNGLRRARMYWHQYTPDPLTTESVWTEVMVTTRKHAHTGLQPRAGYWFRVKAVTKDGEEVYTDPVLRVVV